jgi:hypothetical protein
MVQAFLLLDRQQLFGLVTPAAVSHHYSRVAGWNQFHRRPLRRRHRPAVDRRRPRRLRPRTPCRADRSADRLARRVTRRPYRMTVCLSTGEVAAGRTCWRG